MISALEQADFIPNGQQLAILALLKKVKFPDSTSPCNWMILKGELYLAIPYSDAKDKVRNKMCVYGFLNAQKINKVIEDQSISKILIKEEYLSQLLISLQKNPKGWLDYNTIVNNISPLAIDKVAYYCEEFLELDQIVSITFKFSVKSAVEMMQKIFGVEVLQVKYDHQCSLRLDLLASLSNEEKAKIVKKLIAFATQCDELKPKLKHFLMLCPDLKCKILRIKNNQVHLELSTEEAKFLLPLLDFLGATLEDQTYVIPPSIFFSKEFTKNVKRKVTECNKNKQKPVFMPTQRQAPRLESEDERNISAILSKAFNKYVNFPNVSDLIWETNNDKRFLLIYARLEFASFFSTFFQCHNLDFNTQGAQSTFLISKENADRLSSILQEDRHMVLNFLDMMELIPTCLDKSSYLSTHNIDLTHLFLNLTRSEESGLRLLLSKSFVMDQGIDVGQAELTNGKTQDVKYHSYQVPLASLIKMPFKERLDLIVSFKNFIAEREAFYVRVKTFFFMRLASLCDMTKNILIQEGYIRITLNEKTAVLIEPILFKLNAINQGGHYIFLFESFKQLSDDDLDSLCLIVEKRINNFNIVKNLLRKLGVNDISIGFNNVQISCRSKKDHAICLKILSACQIEFNYSMFFELDETRLSNLGAETDRFLQTRNDQRKAMISLMRVLKCWLPDRAAWADVEDSIIATKLDPACALVFAKLPIPGLAIKREAEISAVIPVASLLALQENDFSTIQTVAETEKRKLQIMMSMIQCVRQATQLKYTNDGCVFLYKNIEAKTCFNEHCADLLKNDSDDKQGVISYELVLEKDVENLAARLTRLEKAFKQNPVESSALSKGNDAAAAARPRAPKPAKKAHPKVTNKNNSKTHKKDKKKIPVVVTATSSQAAEKVVSSGPQIGQQPNRDFSILDHRSSSRVLDLEAFLNINPDQLAIVPVMSMREPLKVVKTEEQPLAQPEKLNELAIQEELMNMRCYYDEWRNIPKQIRQRKDIHYSIVCDALNLSLKRLMNAINLRIEENPFCYQLSQDGDDIARKIRNILMHEFPLLRGVIKLYKSLEQNEIGSVFNCVLNNRESQNPLKLSSYSQGFFQCLKEINYQDLITIELQKMSEYFDLYNDPSFKAFSKKTLIKDMEGCVVNLGTLAKYLRLTRGFNNDIWDFVISCKQLRNDTSHNNINDESTGFDPLSPDVVLQQVKNGIVAIKSWRAASEASSRNLNERK